MASLGTSGGGAHGDSSFDKWIHSDTAGAEGRALHSPKRDHVPPHVSPMMLAHSSGTMLMDGHKAPMTARFPRPTASRPFLLSNNTPHQVTSCCSAAKRRNLANG